MECVTCKRTDDQVRLSKCAICHKYYCDEHSYLMSGRTFCSKFCAAYFFFDEDD